MEKKKYTKPTVIKVELNHEQAILGTCSSTGTSVSQSNPSVCKAGGCKQAPGQGDSAYSS